MKTNNSIFFIRFLLVIGVFSLTTFITYGAVANGGLFKSTPYQTRNTTADATLARLTNGSGIIILDGLVAKINVKATEKAGTSIEGGGIYVPDYNTYIDSRLTALDKLDDEVRKEYGPDYAFLFQYIYPRILELKKAEDKTPSIIDRIGSALGMTSNSSKSQTNTNSRYPTCQSDDISLVTNSGTQIWATCDLGVTNGTGTGKLVTLSEAVCASGYHIPTVEDWRAMVTHAGYFDDLHFANVPSVDYRGLVYGHSAGGNEQSFYWGSSDYTAPNGTVYAGTKWLLGNGVLTEMLTTAQNKFLARCIKDGGTNSSSTQPNTTITSSVINQTSNNTSNISISSSATTNITPTSPSPSQTVTSSIFDYSTLVVSERNPIISGTAKVSSVYVDIMDSNGNVIAGTASIPVVNGHWSKAVIQSLNNRTYTMKLHNTSDNALLDIGTLIVDLGETSTVKSSSEPRVCPARTEGVFPNCVTKNTISISDFGSVSNISVTYHRCAKDNGCTTNDDNRSYYLVDFGDGYTFGGNSQTLDAANCTPLDLFGTCVGTLTHTYIPSKTVDTPTITYTPKLHYISSLDCPNCTIEEKISKTPVLAFGEGKTIANVTPIYLTTTPNKKTSQNYLTTDISKSGTDSINVTLYSWAPANGSGSPYKIMFSGGNARNCNTGERCSEAFAGCTPDANGICSTPVAITHTYTWKNAHGDFKTPDWYGVLVEDKDGNELGGHVRVGVTVSCTPGTNGLCPKPTSGD